METAKAIVRKVGENEYQVESLGGRNAAYTVTLGQAQTCSCPHYQYRLAGTSGTCKHIDAARREAKALAAAEIAKTCTDQQLDKALAKYPRGVICDVVQDEKRQRARENPVLTPEGWRIWPKSVRTGGPANEREAYGR